MLVLGPLLSGPGETVLEPERSTAGFVKVVRDLGIHLKMENFLYHVQRRRIQLSV